MIREHDADTLVLGLPLNADGSEGPRAKLTRQFGVLLQNATELPLHYQDERLTTYAADQRLAGTGRTHRQKKAARDAIAAAEILQDFLGNRR
jgi:putative Holliday junction resolvase